MWFFCIIPDKVRPTRAKSHWKVHSELEDFQLLRSQPLKKKNHCQRFCATRSLGYGLKHVSPPDADRCWCFTFRNPIYSPQPLDCELAEASAEIQFYKIKCHQEPLLQQICCVFGMIQPSSELLWLQKSPWSYEDWTAFAQHWTIQKKQTSAWWELAKSKTFALCVFSYISPNDFYCTASSSMLNFSKYKNHKSRQISHTGPLNIFNGKKNICF